MITRSPFTKIAWPLVLVVGLALITVVPGPAASTPEDDAAIAQLEGLNRAFTSIARRVTPTVVTVTTKQEVKAPVRSRRRIPLPFQPFFEDPRFQDRQPEPRQRRGLGSGIVMTSDGYILTNNHVAGEADEIIVIMGDEREYEATLVGADSLSDVAVIKIEVDGLPAATIGDSDKLEIGEWVLAVGAPMGLRATVTSGIVSAFGRDINIINNPYGVEDFIQTDAAINPGNSGGALVDLHGKVIGVNTAIASQTGGFIGYGFAIPINLAKKVMDDIIAHGRARRGYLGVSLRDVDAAIADAVGLDRPRGVLIADVLAESPAEAAGLKPEDILLSVDGQSVDRPNHVQSLIARKHPDDTVSLQVRRKNNTLTLSAKLGEKSPGDVAAAGSRQAPGGVEHLGLTVQNITPDVAESFGLEEGAEGVVVTDVRRGPARDGGFQPGDIIYKVRQGRLERDIGSVKDFESALEKLQKGRNAAFSIWRGNSRQFLTLKIPE